MKAVVQRARNASVTVEGRVTGRISRGLLVYLGVAGEDSEKDAAWMADKIANLRIFEDAQGKMNLSLKDRFFYSDVTRDPFIYRDCHVIWRGMASNLVVEQNHTSFDFLVGYDTRRTMEGIVLVDYDFAIPVNPEYPVEILGRVVIVPSDRGAGIRIQGIALNQTGLLEQSQNRN